MPLPHACRVLIRRGLTGAEYAVPALIGLLAVLGVANSFTGHVTPDSSVYLLHARTFVQTLDRFTLSHDSKGLMLCLVLAPTVMAFGATMVAAAIPQFMAHGVACLCLFSIARSYASARGAATLALLCLCTVHAHLIWGGNVRPEDFALGYTAIAFWAAWRGTPRGLFWGGVACACCLFTKTTLVLAPATVLVAGCLIPPLSVGADGNARGFPPAREVGWRALWAGLGFGLVTAAVLAWVTLFDNLTGMVRQCIQWPAEYRRLHVPGLTEIEATMRLINRTGLTILLVAAFLGLVRGWLRGPRRLSLLLALALLGELLRITVEGARWPYTLTVAVLPMLLGSGLLLADKSRWRRSFLPAAIPALLALIHVLALTAQAEGQAFFHRVWMHRPSPYEHLAAQMRASGYREGETVLVPYNDYQIILLLNAPRPYPLLPLDFKRVPEQEQVAAQRHYRQFSPQWVVTRMKKYKGRKWKIKGGVDHAYHVVMAPGDASVPPGDATDRNGATLSALLPDSAVYRKVLDAGYLQAWRLVECPTPQQGAGQGRLSVRASDKL